jgi:ADP-dependent NAD(P)H-hydrate dehydratase / NAD(P)H-hydrate epimerase
MTYRSSLISQVIVTAKQMREIEERIFAAGMPVAALMEKVAGLISDRIEQIITEQINISTSNNNKGGGTPPLLLAILVGPGHNGGDALVVARELHFRGYAVSIYCPFANLKELTKQHLGYVESLGIPCHQSIDALQNCDLVIDGLFGYGLERELTNPIASAINTVNEWSKPVISIDIPSGLHTDTGEVLGTAIHATHTLCLGLWKLGLLQDSPRIYWQT